MSELTKFIQVQQRDNHKPRLVLYNVFDEY